MKVILAKRMGFCAGVRYAFNKVNEVACQWGDPVQGDPPKRKRGRPNGSGAKRPALNLFILGDIVHNASVVRKVSALGVTNVPSPDGIRNATVMVRTHGATKEDYERLAANGNKIIDLTCAIVKMARKKALKLEESTSAIVVIGHKDHPEVRGLVSWLKNPFVVESDDDIDALPPLDSIGVVSQTTFSKDEFDRLVMKLKLRFSDLTVAETICGHTVANQRASAALARECDKMVVVGAKKSSNSRRLYEAVKRENQSTFFVEDAGDLELSRFSHDETVGVTAGASTPEWTVEEIVNLLSEV
jgi:4-hydroxy-3-methylbut-2-enyl diphosphate reductase